jgi:hypothetical protein
MLGDLEESPEESAVVGGVRGQASSRAKALLEPVGPNPEETMSNETGHNEPCECGSGNK